MRNGARALIRNSALGRATAKQSKERPLPHCRVRHGAAGRHIAALVVADCLTQELKHNGHTRRNATERVVNQ